MTIHVLILEALCPCFWRVAGVVAWVGQAAFRLASVEYWLHYLHDSVQLEVRVKTGAQSVLM